LTFIADGITNDAVNLFNSSVQTSFFPSIVAALQTLDISQNASILQPFKTALTANLPNGTLPGQLNFAPLQTASFNSSISSLQSSLNTLNSSYNNLAPAVTDGLLQAQQFASNSTLLTSMYSLAIAQANVANSPVLVSPVTYTANIPISGYPTTPPFVAQSLSTQNTYLQTIQSGFPSPQLVSQTITTQQNNLTQSAINALKGTVGVLSSGLDNLLFTSGNLTNNTSFASVQSSIAGFSTSFANSVAPYMLKYNSYRYYVTVSGRCVSD
jgi:hypothetical protein